VLISVVVPVYNVEKYLKKCIQSIIKQTHENIEIICIDDGSTDQSGKIIDELAANEPRIKAIHQQNSGTMQVRTRAIAEARGEYIAFIDSDDYVAPRMLEILLEGIQKNGAQIAVGGFEIVDDEDKRLSSVTPTYKTLDKTDALKELLIADYRLSGLYPLWNKLYKKELFETYKPSPHINTLGEDQYMNLVFIDAAQRVYFTDELCYSYLQRADSVMKTPKLSHVDDFFGLWMEKKPFINKLGLLKTNKKELFEAYFNAVFDFYGLCYKTDKLGLIPHFNELLKRDEYFKISNLPLSLKNILRAGSFLARRYL
jgi:glycosyltransferase involved in cell wall biosynthesis